MSTVGYTGPDDNYKPHIGDNKITPAQPTTAASLSYANLSYLLDRLRSVQLQSQAVIAAAELQLQTRVLPITDSDPDAKLRDANTSEWPQALGSPKNQISYRYYRALELRSTQAASYIRQRYEEALRDVNGTNAIDVLKLATIIRDESSLALEYVSAHIGELNDPAELRSVELLQDWAEAALVHTGTVRSLLEKGESERQFPSDELEQLGVKTASDAQALLKVQLNRSNADLLQSMDFFKKNFSDFAQVFYTKYLGPALAFRKQVTTNVYPVLPGRLGREVNAAVDSLDHNLETLLADQTRRNMLFDQKMNQIEGSMDMRDTYRSYVSQLASLGTPIPVGNPGVITEGEDDPEDAAAFEDIAANPTPTSSLTADHNSLTGRDALDAHSQYLLKSGGTITGDVTLADNVKIDGMEPKHHRHTGLDGTQKIHGSDIEGGTIGTGAIDQEDKPSKPTNLHLVNLNSRIIPPGVTIVDAVVAWDGESNYTYEVQNVIKR